MLQSDKKSVLIIGKILVIINTNANRWLNLSASHNGRVGNSLDFLHIRPYILTNAIFQPLIRKTQTKNANQKTTYPLQNKIRGSRARASLRVWAACPPAGGRPRF